MQVHPRGFRHVAWRQGIVAELHAKCDLAVDHSPLAASVRRCTIEPERGDGHSPTSSVDYMPRLPTRTSIGVGLAPSDCCGAVVARMTLPDVSSGSS